MFLGIDVLKYLKIALQKNYIFTFIKSLELVILNSILGVIFKEILAEGTKICMIIDHCCPQLNAQTHIIIFNCWSTFHSNKQIWALFHSTIRQATTNGGGVPSFSIIMAYHQYVGDFMMENNSKIENNAFTLRSSGVVQCFITSSLRSLQTGSISWNSDRKARKGFPKVIRISEDQHLGLTVGFAGVQRPGKSTAFAYYWHQCVQGYFIWKTS